MKSTAIANLKHWLSREAEAEQALARAEASFSLVEIQAAKQWLVHCTNKADEWLRLSTEKQHAD